MNDSWQVIISHNKWRQVMKDHYQIYKQTYFFIYKMKYYDVIIIGGGISGLSCGYTLSKYDKKVLLIEK